MSVNFLFEQLHPTISITTEILCDHTNIHERSEIIDWLGENFGGNSWIPNYERWDWRPLYFDGEKNEGRCSILIHNVQDTIAFKLRWV